MQIESMKSSLLRGSLGLLISLGSHAMTRTGEHSTGKEKEGDVAKGQVSSVHETKLSNGVR